MTKHKCMLIIVCCGIGTLQVLFWYLLPFIFIFYFLCRCVNENNSHFVSDSIKYRYKDLEIKLNIYRMNLHFNILYYVDVRGRKTPTLSLDSIEEERPKPSPRVKKSDAQESYSRFAHSLLITFNNFIDKLSA